MAAGCAPEQRDAERIARASAALATPLAVGSGARRAGRDVVVRRHADRALEWRSDRRRAEVPAVCENWYQGLGFEVAQIKPMAELPAEFRPRLLHNVALLVEVVPGELRNIVFDAARFVRDPSQPFNRAQHSGGGFVAGKDGGTYQMHNPGISALIFPAYFVDRQFAQIVPGSKAQWPQHLPVVNALMLGIDAAWTV